MDAPAGRQWFLRKHTDGMLFGPLAFEQLARWAWSAQVAPHDSISTDQETWMKAPMLPELAMDWIVEVTSERLYGPTTLGAIQEFMRLGEIDHDTFIINACDATRQRIGEIASLLTSDPVLSQSSALGSESDLNVEPAPTGMSIAVQDRIRQLEDALRDERRAHLSLQQQYAELEARHRALGESQTPP